MFLLYALYLYCFTNFLLMPSICNLTEKNFLKGFQSSSEAKMFSSELLTIDKQGKLENMVQYPYLNVNIQPVSHEQKRLTVLGFMYRKVCEALLSNEKLTPAHPAFWQESFAIIRRIVSSVDYKVKINRFHFNSLAVRRNKLPKLQKKMICVTHVHSLNRKKEE